MLVDHLLHGEAAFHAGTACAAQALPQGFVRQKCDEAYGRSGSVFIGDKKSCVFMVHCFGRAADCSGNDRQTSGHRLQHDIREALRTGEQSEQVARKKQRRNVGHMAEKVDAAGDAKRCRKGLELDNEGLVGPLASDCEMSGRAASMHYRRRAKKDIRTLPDIYVCNRCDQGDAGRQAEHSPCNISVQFKMKPIEIETVVDGVHTTRTKAVDCYMLLPNLLGHSDDSAVTIAQETIGSLVPDGAKDAHIATARDNMPNPCKPRDNGAKRI